MSLCRILSHCQIVIKKMLIYSYFYEGINVIESSYEFVKLITLFYYVIPGPSDS